MPWDIDSSPRTLAAKELASSMASAVFSGDFKSADKIVERYRKTYPDDPHARGLFSQVYTSSSLLSFRSDSTSLVDFYQQREARVRAWFKHMPFDIQLLVTQVELFGSHYRHAPIEAFSWTQWHDLLEAPDPSAHLRKSPLFPIERTKGSRTGVKKIRHSIGKSIRFLAMECLNNGTHEMLDQIMTQGRVCAWDACDDFFLYHQSKNSSGWTYAQLVQPIPFWALGIFHDNAAQGYWDVMRKHGGPMTPFTPSHSPTPLPSASGKNRRTSVPSAPAPTDFSDPLGWLLPSQTLSNVLSDPGTAHNLASRVKGNVAAWRQMSLLHHANTSISPAPPPPIPSM